MSYRLEPGEPLPGGIKRIATEQIDQALNQLRNFPEGRPEAVHDARKRFKKIRAVLRLVRDEIGAEIYHAENVCFRDAGRRLAEVRDSYVSVETVDDLTARFSGQLTPNVFSKIRTQLMDRHQEIVNQLLDQENRLEEVASTIETAGRRVADWPVHQDDFSAICGGLRRVYKRGRNRMAEAYAEPVSQNFHEWRKRSKYLWYHLRILKPLWPNLLNELADELHNLSDYLGDDHDLAELRRTVTSQPEMFEEAQALQRMVALIDRRRAELEAAARPLGERIFVEKPADFVDRIATYWSIWQKKTEASVS